MQHGDHHYLSIDTKVPLSVFLLPFDSYTAILIQLNLA